MNKKMIASCVLAALMMGGLSGIQAAPSLEDHETRIVELESLTDKIDDRSETDHLAIKALKKNKADKEETQTALKENKDLIIQEIKDRKSANRILNQSIKDEAAAREAKDTELDGKITAEETARKAEDTKIREEFAKADKELEKKLMGKDAALAGRIDKLATDTDKGLAKVSALAGLHPLDYDPANKLNLAAAGGSYNGEHAFALGAFYRPNRNIMLSFGSSIAGGDNAYNVGISVKVGKGGDRINQSNTTVSELYDLVGRLQDQVAAQQKKIEELQAK